MPNPAWPVADTLCRALAVAGFNRFKSSGRNLRQIAPERQLRSVRLFIGLYYCIGLGSSEIRRQFRLGASAKVHFQSEASTISLKSSLATAHA